MSATYELWKIYRVNSFLSQGYTQQWQLVVKLGKYCSGKFCTNPKLHLRAAHTCPGCKGIVHVPCGSFDEKQDLYWCKLCASKRPAKLSE
eukprot:10294011-Ditylum_brightwellii.AAC.1